jgi:hypothetical protein
VSQLTAEQHDYLLSGIHPARVKRLRGQSHLEAWDVRRTLTRVFGFGGWNDETIELTHVTTIETPGTRTRNDGTTDTYTKYTVVYRAQVRLTVKSPDGVEIAHFDDGAAGDAVNQPSLGDAHDMAMKTALSQALKRCAVNLGDQFGLCLYNDGRCDPVVIRTLTQPAESAPSGQLPAEDPVGSDPDEARRVLAPDTSVEDVSQDPDDYPQPTSPAQPVTQYQHRRMHALWAEIGFGGRPNRAPRIDITSKLIGRPIASSSDLTSSEADIVIAALVARKNQTGVAA